MKLRIGQINIKKYAWVALIAVVLIALVVAFLYYDRTNAISLIIQRLGFSGAILAILLISVLCMTPIPSEGLVVLFLKVYGVYWGTIFAWIGSILSSLIIFALARHYGQRFVKKVVNAESFELVDHWVERKGTLGLFVARLLPVPAFAVNYVAGVIPSVRFWPYVWTAAVSIIPYYIGTALVFLGVSREVWRWLIVGCLAIIAFWATGYVLNRHRLK